MSDQLVAGTATNATHIRDEDPFVSEIRNLDSSNKTASDRCLKAHGH